MHPYHDPTTARNSLEFGALALRMGLSLVFVIAMVFLTAYVLRICGKQQLNPGGGRHNLRLMQTLPMGGGRFLHLIAIGQRWFVVSGAGNQMNLLLELPKEDAEAMSRSSKSPAAASGSSAAELIARVQDLRVRNHGHTAAWPHHLKAIEE